MVNMFSRQISLTVKKNAGKKTHCKKLQENLTPMTPFIHRELSIMKQTVKRTTLNAIGYHATVFSIGRDYHSCSHVDLDMYYTLATVIAPEGISPEDVIYYFVFPTFKIKIPLRSGNSSMFDPSILHSCSNPKYEGCYIMPAYVSTKTVLTSTHL